MKLTVLFDLDDTLLSNNMDSFLPVYLKALSQQLVQVPGEKMVKNLLYATGKMTEKDDPILTLEQTFDRYFYPAIGHSKEDLRDTLDNFYQEHFSALHFVTQVRPEAVQLVEFSFNKGWDVVIATNPLFPKMATYHRLKWAGLPVEKYPFALVTTFETFHFSKPNPAYLAEILAQVGWKNQPAVMIGDDWDLDIKPACDFGLPVFWISTSEKPLPDNAHPLSSKGQLGDVQVWLEKIERSKIELIYKSPEAILAILKAVPAALLTLVQQLPEDKWHFRPNDQEWNLAEICCHLRDVDREVNLPRLAKVMDEENPFLVGEITDQWAEIRRYSLQNGPEALKSFVEARVALIDKLSTCQPDWSRSARHAIFGPTTLKELAGFMVAHDTLHVQQAFACIQNGQKQQ